MMGKFAKQILIVLIVVVVTSIVVRATDSRIFSSEDLVDGCPVDMVYVVAEYGGFCMDKYEVSAGDNCSHKNPTSQLESRFNIDNANCEAVSEPGRMPWRYVSQNQAQMICAKMGKRLPTNKEWSMAALGTPDFLEKNTKYDCHIRNNWPKQPGLTGSGKHCESSNGVFDMIGNVWEWTSETSNNGKIEDIDLPDGGYVVSVNGDGYPTKTSKEGDPNYYNDYLWVKRSGSRAVARGGNWDNEEKAGVYAYYAVLEPSFAGSGVGFRCVK